ncbi:PREDICTED: E3 ubiquitin-protein ligase MARCH6-like [Branchiostoma belcheri]|uniref:E3 ubiquitin-protein ligase MARCHF6 n=1 Tax=Branchiostoma belcheri TaxID=7741 RepID=A0A6P4Z6G9_BRABE|nr:PREDICTED: E3 ubiquitin-protein ligase MARCH6-like [Branchiostoma belcheri]
MEDDEATEDICRVCRSEGSQDKPLYHPCVCTGSIKYIHQECLIQWLKHSKKEYCELCKHRFAFTPIYSPDMPATLPIKDIVSGLFTSIGTAVRYWFHYTLVAFAWLGVVPLTACRIYRCLFTGSVSSLLTLPLDMLSTENLMSDCLQGCFVVTCSLCAFISLVWLREQIVHGGGPQWLEQQNNQEEPAAPAAPANNAPPPPAAPPPPEDEDGIGLDNADAGDIFDDTDEEGDNNAGDGEGDDPNNGAQDDVNWNAIEWDRAAEELTWERMLGLDGSLVFLEHVFWVVSLNTLFILVFAFCPYHVGHFAAAAVKIDDYLVASQFEGLLTTMIGYLILATALVFSHAMASFLGFQRAKRVLGICYVVVKVSLLVVLEIGVFPLVCGWWLDICSLAMFDATLKDRETSFRAAPGTAMFLHWLVGMVYVFYFASFILLLREVVRPGVLWFLRNLNDPDFNPVQEMIHLPIHRHARRFLLSVVVFGTTVLLMLYVPIQVIKWAFPTFLPYHVMLSSDAPVSELSLELLLLQVVLPALLEQGHTRQWLKSMVKVWTVGTAWMLNLRSYLLGDVPVEEVQGVLIRGEDNVQPGNNPAPAGANNIDLQDGGLHAAHQAILQQAGPIGFQPYKRPRWFAFRLVLLVFLMCETLAFTSFVGLTLPVGLGRAMMSVWMGEAKVHELYTAACGLYTLWLVCRILSVMFAWVPQGWTTVVRKLSEWSMMAIKTIVLAVLLLGAVPLLLGLLFELVVVVPLRVPLDQSPLFFPWQDWALGVLHAKIICAMTMMGPQWWLKRVMEQVYQDGIRNMNLHLVVFDLALPVITCLLFCLCIPYLVAVGVVPHLGLGGDVEVQVLRRIYPSLLVLVLVSGLFTFQARQFKRLYEHIKNDKYLVGQRLVNYDKNKRSRESTPQQRVVH